MQIHGHPIRPHGGVAVGRGDDPARTPQPPQPPRRLVHHQPPRRADVRVRLGQQDLNDVQPHPGMRRREPPRPRHGGVGAIVGQHQHLVAFRVERTPRRIDLRGQRGERGGDARFLVVDGDGHAEFATGGGRFVHQGPGGRGQAGKIKRVPISPGGSVQGAGDRRGIHAVGGGVWGPGRGLRTIRWPITLGMYPADASRVPGQFRPAARPGTIQGHT